MARMRLSGGLWLAVIFLAAACVPSKANVPHEVIDERTAVEVMPARRGALVARGNYHGRLDPLAEVWLSAEVGGTVKQVPVDEGATVTRDTLLVALDEEPYRLAEAQAEQNLASAKVRVAQLETGIKVERLRLEAGMEQAKAAVEMADARVDLVESGTRPEEKKQARAGREAARAALENARAEYERIKLLYDENAATRQMLDGARSAMDSAQARFEQAEQLYRLAVKGPREEDKEQARAGRRQAQGGLNSAQAALEILAVREKELEAARLAVHTAELAVEQAQYNRGKTKIKSPVEGSARVSTRSIDPGEMAAPGMRLMELLDTSKMELVLQVPSRDVNYIKEGEKVPVRCIGDLHQEARTGVVEYVSVKANSQNTTFPVKVVLPNADGSLRAGQICEANPELETYDEILVPRDIVLDTEEGKMVLVVQDGIAREVLVKVVAERKGLAAVSKGLSEGDQVIVVGARLAHDGEEVDVKATRPSVVAADQPEEE